MRLPVYFVQSSRLTVALLFIFTVLLSGPTTTASPTPSATNTLLVASATCGKPVCTFNAFGPKKYIRTDSDTRPPVRQPRGDRESPRADEDQHPSVFIDNFSVQNTASQYTLRMDAITAPNVVVRINDTVVAGPSEFQQQVQISNGNGVIEKPVTLQLKNKIQVELRGREGIGFNLTIVGVDNDPPDITATARPAPNAAGWNNTNVVVSFTCSDKTSGVASCPAPVTVSNEGGNQIIKGTAIDKAGNSATASVTLNIDKTPPSISAASTPSPTSAGWNNSNVTVAFTCNDAISGIAVCPAPVTVSAEGAKQVVSGRSVDQAGNAATANVTLNIDKTPPSISANAKPAPNPKGWNKSDVTVAFTCSDSLSGIALCPPPQVVSNEGANQAISGIATDKAGNAATATANVSLDKTAPTLVITSPPNGSTISLSTAAIGLSGTENDALSGVASVTCGGAQGLISGSSFTCTTPLASGANSIPVQVTDVAGNSQTSNLRLIYAPAPRISITTPANLSVTNISPVTVNGTVSDPGATVTVNGVSAPQKSGRFSVTVPLSEGLNVLAAMATNKAGTTSTATVQTTLDTTPPHITIDSPSDGSTTTDATATVTGMANDVVVGTVNAQDVQVTVNGIAAQVANRTYSAANVPLALGKNIIQAKGVDRAGNGATTSITVSRVPPSQPPLPAIGQALLTQSLSILSGNNQTGAIRTQLPTPLVVVLRDSSNNPLPNQGVVFKVTGNNGKVSAGASGTPSSAVVVNTNANGQAQAFWTLGERAGAGINTVQASSVFAFGSANFAATGLTANAAQIVLDSGNNQTGVLGQPLAFPFVVAVVDSGHNRVPNVPVTFAVKSGGGSLAGSPSQIVNTDGNGRAIAVLTLGVLEGIENNVVEANFPANPGFPAAFAASARAPGDPANTTISGVVLDNSNNPIQGVTLRLFQTNQGNNSNLPVQVGTPVLTGAKGTFLIRPAPVGFFKLMADGTTAAGPKNYPTLEYDIVTVAGNENTVGMPIYLPALDTTNKLCVDETHGGTLILPQVPGFALTVLPGSATFPGGSRQGCVTVTPVNGDKVPMSPGFGQQPRFIVTIQPVGTKFDPPAPITLPNVDGLLPKAVTEMYSYDHDLGMFIAIGTGAVSADGSVIASNPGVGVLKAGWHCGGDPNKPGSGEIVHVKITTQKPVLVAKDKTTTIESTGGPLPGTFSWKTSDASVAAINGSSSNSSVIVKGVSAGTAVLTVRFTCASVDQDGVHPFAEDSTKLTVVEVKLSIDGVADANKLSTGGLVVRQFDGNNAPRKTIILQAGPSSSNGSVVLTRNNDRVKVFTAASGGTEIAFDGTDNKFAISSIPSTGLNLWVEGNNFSDAMRDVTLTLTLDSMPAVKDTITFTVLWLDQPTIVTSGTVSTNNAAEAAYRAQCFASGTLAPAPLGGPFILPKCGTRMGWGTEASAKVHPANFVYPGNDLRLERDTEFHDWNGNGTSTIRQRRYNTNIPPGNDTSDASARDDDPAPNDTIYDLDVPGLLLSNAAQGTIKRTRNNFKAFSSITIGSVSVRCSQVTEYLVRFSIKQIDAPDGTHWVVIFPADVINDNQAAVGKTLLTWDLK